MPEWRRICPIAPYGLMLLLGLIEPLTHAWIRYFPPEGAVPTGLHTGDSGHHLVAMASFANGFHSPFATCLAESMNDIGYFSVPIFLLYGVVGEIGRMTGLTPFIFLGIANGMGGALLLWSVYRFLQRIAPKDAALAFYLYALGGGLGGIIFLSTWLAGGTDAPGFQDWFMRFAQYELIEGQYLSPILLMPRLYYTLPMALGFAALTALIETDWCRCPGHLFFTCFLLFFVACINVRLAPLFWGAGAAYMLLGSQNDGRYRAWLAGCTLGATALGGCIAMGIMGLHPTYAANVSSVARECTLLLPLLYATIFFWPPLALGVLSGVRTQPRFMQSVMAALLAYLLAYALVYLGHQAWYGNGWRGGDIGAAVMASDWALLALLPGAVLGWKWNPGERPAAPSHLRWIAAWLLVLLALSVSATGQGWLLQFAPQRCMVLLGVPMALLAAAGLRSMPKVAARVCLVLLIGGGVLSQAVAALYFQGPLGRIPGEGPFAYLHYEFMTEADARLLTQLPAGTVAVPPWSPIAFGEIVAHHGDHQVIGGPGAMNLGDQPFGPLQEAANRFFSTGANESDRRDFVTKWCVDFVYCPDTCPVDGAVLEGLRQFPWLEVIAEEGRGVVFRVKTSGTAADWPVSSDIHR